MNEAIFVLENKNIILKNENTKMNETILILKNENNNMSEKILILENVNQ